MENNQPKEFQDRVERAVEALRTMEVPAGPPSELARRTAVLAGEGDVQELRTTHARGWWNVKMIRRTAVAAGLAILVGAGALLVVWEGASKTAFADVIQQVKQVHAVKCQVTADIELPDHTRQSTTMEMVMVDPGISIISMPGMKMITDERHHKMILLEPTFKLATVIDIKQSPQATAKAVPDVLDYFKQMTPEGSTALGERQIGNVKARGFRSAQADRQTDVWADEKTDLPVLVVMTMQNSFIASGTYTFSQFDWNPKVDPDDAAAKVPDGYQVSNTSMDLLNVGEGDVTKMLKTLAESNDGTLPDSIDQTGVIQALMPAAMRQAQAVAQKAGGTPEEMQKVLTDSMQKEMLEKMTPISRAWSFMMDKSKGTEWTYAGEGAKGSEKGHAVLWYKVTGTDKWRVFDADGAVHEEAVAPAGGKKFVVSAPPADSPPSTGSQTRMATPAQTQPAP